MGNHVTGIHVSQGVDVTKKMCEICTPILYVKPILSFTVFPVIVTAEG